MGENQIEKPCLELLHLKQSTPKTLGTNKF